MSYTKTTWLEHGHTTAQKITALGNLENMYTQAVSYIDAITHSSRYYTEAQCSSMYFTSATDGSGSGLIAKYLDGYTAEQIISAGSPSGVICWWSGSEASIPSGFVLCNGLNGTPDLRDRFVVGSGSHYARNDTGGANTVTTTGTVTIAGHTLTAGEIPKHTHGSITDYYGTGGGHAYSIDVAKPAWYYPTDVARTTGSTGDGGSHTHSASWAGTSNQEKRPPYYALCFIMKS
jgi:hypothetical protein